MPSCKLWEQGAGEEEEGDMVLYHLCVKEGGGRCVKEGGGRCVKEGGGEMCEGGRGRCVKEGGGRCVKEGGGGV